MRKSELMLAVVTKARKELNAPRGRARKYRDRELKRHDSFAIAQNEESTRD